MDKPLFMLGQLPVSPEMALLAGAGGLAVVLVAAVWIAVAAVRGANRGIAEAAEAGLESLKAGLREQIEERDTRIGELKSALAEEARAHSDLKARYAAMRASMEEQARQNQEKLELLARARQQMTDEFKALAGEVLKTQSETFTKQNREQVDLLLKPLSEKIGEFQKGLTSDRAALIEQVRMLNASSVEVAHEASNLTRALKGNAQVQGAWGEMVLTTILERSGLRKGEEFRVQQSHTGEDGARLRTDVEVCLPPNGDLVIIDSKVSLTAFEAYVNATEDEEREAHLKAHVVSLRNHIRTLGGKEYHQHAESGLDFVLMFVPIEAAFATATAADPGLIDYALGQNVCLTTPATLMSALRTIRNIWQIEHRQKNAEEIAERAGRLYDKVVGFLDNMDRVGDAIDRTRKSFDDARGQLATGNGNLVRQVEMLRELGARTGKRIPDDWLEGDAAIEPSRLIAPVESEPIN